MRANCITATAPTIPASESQAQRIERDGEWRRRAIDLMDDAAEGGEERDVERDAPEPSERHRTLPLGAFTRLGCWAMYVAVCFTRICVPSNVVE